MLQQTTFQDPEETMPNLSALGLDEPSNKSEQSAVQYVIESDTYRNDYLREVASLATQSTHLPLLGKFTLIA